MWPWPCRSQEDTPVFTVKSSVEYALKHSAQILSSMEGVAAAEALKKKEFTEFLPKLSANYTYMRMDEEKRIAPGVITSPEDLYTFTATIDQPIFSGFSRLTQYEVSALNLDVAKFREQQARNDIILKVKTAYFQVLFLGKHVRATGARHETLRPLEVDHVAPAVCVIGVLSLRANSVVRCAR